MAFRPGTNITFRDAVPTEGPSTDISRGFMTGLTESGPTDRAVLVTSLTQYQRVFGKTSTGLIADVVETAFKEGASELVVSRVVGPTSKAASASLTDGTVPIIKLVAPSVGEFGNKLSASVISVSSGTQVILTRSGIEIERSPILATKADALVWAERSPNVNGESLAGTNPLAAQPAVAFQGGTDDRANITDADHQLALDRLDDEFGPGQVATPGRTTPEAHKALLAHAEKYNRVALLDAPVDATTVSALQAASNAIKNESNASYGILLAPWVRVDSPQATKVVPPSALQLGIEARRDRLAGPQQPAAGPQYPTRTARDLTVSFNAEHGDELNSSGVALYRKIHNRILPYGYRSAVDPEEQPNWIRFTDARTRMTLVSRCNAVAEQYAFRSIDGQRKLLKAFQADIMAVCQDLYLTDTLYGQTPEEAYQVFVGDDLNTDESLDKGEILAVVQCRFSPFAELVSIEIVKQPTALALA